MSTKYLVIEEKICDECEGCGYTYNEIWQIYWAENLDPDKTTRESDMQWFRNQGYGVYKWEDLPPEEVPCVECEGRGIIRREVDLKTVLPELLGVTSQLLEACKAAAPRDYCSHGPSIAIPFADYQKLRDAIAAAEGTTK